MEKMDMREKHFFPLIGPDTTEDIYTCFKYLDPSNIDCYQESFNQNNKRVFMKKIAYPTFN